MSKLQPLKYLDITRQEAEKKIIFNRISCFQEIYEKSDYLLIKNQSGRCLDCGNPYCEDRCPLHNYIPNWLELIEANKLELAADLLHQTNPLPEMCGRICPQDRLCEGACTLNDGFGAVTIGNIERYIGDNALANGWRPNLSGIRKKNKQVAIIGAGPAGLGCTDFLLRHGIDTDIFDKYPEIGGLMTFGIPSFKLEKSVIKRRRDVFEDMGARFYLNHEVDSEKFDKIHHKYDAIFLAMGNYNTINAGIDGENLQEVYQALPYLISETNYHCKFQLSNPYINLANKVVVVLGGGDTAMDCSRTAIRQGASKVICIYRRDEKSMPGSRHEFNNAKEEGVQFIYQSQPIAIIGDSYVKGIKIIKTELYFSESKQQQLVKHLKGSEHVIDADAVIVAFGFKPSPANWLLKYDITSGNNGLIRTNNAPSYSTNNPKIFVGGDMLHGSDLVVTAIADGREAAREIINYLS